MGVSCKAEGWKVSQNGKSQWSRVTRIRDSFWLPGTSIIAKIQGVFLVNIRLAIPLHSGTILPLKIKEREVIGHVF